jgi:hypothetical protein
LTNRAARWWTKKPQEIQTMTNPIADLNTLLASMSPELQPGVYVYATVPFAYDLGNIVPLATFREREGLTIIVEEREALKAGIDPLFRAAWITLTVHSDLQAVGLRPSPPRWVRQTSVATWSPRRTTITSSCRWNPPKPPWLHCSNFSLTVFKQPPKGHSPTSSVTGMLAPLFHQQNFRPRWQRRTKH